MSGRILDSNESLDNVGNAVETVREIFNAIYPLTRSPYFEATLIEVVNDAVEACILCGKEGMYNYLLSPVESMLTKFLKGDIVSLVDSISTSNNLLDRLDYLLSGKLDSSTSRSSSLLLRALSFSKLAVDLIRDASPNSLAVIVELLSSKDSDAAVWILYRLHTNFKNRSKQITRIKFYNCIIQGPSVQNIKKAAISNLADEISTFLESDSQTPEEFNLYVEWACSAGFPKQTPDSKIWDREMTNTAMQLHGCLLALQINSVPSGPLHTQNTLLPSINAFNRSLQFAVQDLTVSDFILSFPSWNCSYNQS